jgi:ABC-2 type transport system ATP-binding protein
MIELKDTGFSYSRKGAPALSGVTAIIPPGIHLLAGENGAGKTTLLHLIAGISRPTEGECLIDGRPAASDNPSEIRRAFLLEENMKFPGKTIRDFASMHSRFYPGFSQEAFMSNLMAFGLTGDEPMKSLSLGNRKKAQLSYALALGTEVLLLDEPTNALDIQSKEILRRLLANNLDDRQTVIVATHTVTELDTLFDGAVMITRSRLLFAATEEAISARLAFRVGRVPDPEEIYSEIQIGRVLGITPASEDEEPTRVDWRLLYSALHSPQRDRILETLRKTES